MAQCTNRYLSLCGIPARMSRDGYAGENAHIYIPFGGFYFFNGAQYTFPNGTIPQDKSRFIGGTSKPDTFVKSCGC